MSEHESTMDAPAAMATASSDTPAQVATPAATSEQPSSAPQKAIDALILDAGPLIKNTPSLSSLLATATQLYTTPTVLSEIRDPDARNRVQTLYTPFLTVRQPRPDSVKRVAEFAAKTGDRDVLSRADLEIVALTMEVQIEKGGEEDIRLVPGGKVDRSGIGKGAAEKKEAEDDGWSVVPKGAGAKRGKKAAAKVPEPVVEQQQIESTPEPEVTEEVVQVAEELEAATLEESSSQAVEMETGAGPAEVEAVEDDEDDDSDSWITPANIKQHQIRDEDPSATAAGATTAPKHLSTACLTTDFAMQNVLLQMNLNLLSATTLKRVRHLKTHILRCYACFLTTRDMSKQFCPRCGKPTFTRVTCTTKENGQVIMHLKKNMQWNKRGDVYSIPKPTHGTNSGKWKGQGGGKEGWGTELILAPDQKEYTRAMDEKHRRSRKEKDLMDEDYLPGILTGERKGGAGGRVKVGAGRLVNSKKR